MTCAMQLLERRPGQAPGVLGGTVSNGDKDLSTSDIYIYIDMNTLIQ